MPSSTGKRRNAEHRSTDPQEAREGITRRTFIPYQAIIEDLKKHKATVVYDIKRQTANRAEKILQKKMGFEVSAYPYLEAETRKRGFLFARPEDIRE